MQNRLLERAVHIIIILLGVLFTYYSSTLATGFMQDLFLSLGTNLIVVTIVFAIFEYFRVGTNQGTVETENKPAKEHREDTTPRGLRNILKDRKDTSDDPLFTRNYEEPKKGAKNAKK